METSMDILKKNMIELGATKTMTESKTVEIVLLALSGPEEVQRIKHEINILERAVETRRAARSDLMKAEMIKSNASCMKSEYEYAEKRLNEMLEEFRKEVALFNETIKQMETPEARDKVRLSEYYKEQKKDRENDMPYWRKAGRRI